MEPSTTVICELEIMMHVAAIPDEGALPTFAAHTSPVVNPDPVKVIVLLAYTVVGLTLGDALGAAVMVKELALVGPSIMEGAEVLVVTAAFAIDAAVPYVTEGMLQPKDAVGLTAVVMVIVRLPEEMLAVPAPSPP